MTHSKPRFGGAFFALVARDAVAMEPNGKEKLRQAGTTRRGVSAFGLLPQRERG